MNQMDNIINRYRHQNPQPDRTNSYYQGPMPGGEAGYSVPTGRWGPVMSPAAPRAPQFRDPDPIGLTRNSVRGEAMINQNQMYDALKASEMTQRLRDNAGVGLTKEEQYRRRMGMRDQGNFLREMQLRQERNLMPERIAALQDAGMTGRTEAEVAGRSDVAGIQGEAAMGVAGIQGDASRDVATTQAGADRFGSSMGALGNVATAVGGVVGGWLQQGVEKIRQKGDNERLEKLLDASGIKEDQVYQDATGRGTALPQPVQPAEPRVRPVYGDDGRLEYKEVIGSDGRTKLEKYDHASQSPFDPVNNPVEYQQWLQQNPWPVREGAGAAGNAGAAAPGAAAVPKGRMPTDRMPLQGMQPVKGKENEFTWMDGGGNRRKMRRTPEGWQIKTGTRWSYIVNGG